MLTTPILELDGFGVAFGDRVVLASIDLRVQQTGSVTIVGPAGTGKSTLLRTLVGLNDAQPALRTWGAVRVQGRKAPLLARRDAGLVSATASGDRRIAFVMQDARLLTSTVRENLASGLPNRHRYTPHEQTKFLTELLELLDLQELIAELDSDVITLPLVLQRRLAIVRAIASNPSVLCIDEGTANLSEGEAESVLDLLLDESKRRAILFVTHNQRHARHLGGTTALLAGGRIKAHLPTDDFFTDPPFGPVRDFVRTGGCRVPSPMAKAEELDATSEHQELPEAAHGGASRFVGPRGFYWLKPQQLGGLPRPGIVARLEDDLDALKRLGVTTLVTLEEEMTVSSDDLAAFGLAHRFFPIPDMKAPGVERAAAICAEIDSLTRAGAVVAVHCRAGLGRTGTALASQLIWEGTTAVEALELVRGLNPGFIQSQAQVQFLAAFEKHLRSTSPTIRSLNG